MTASIIRDRSKSLHSRLLLLAAGVLGGWLLLAPLAWGISGVQGLVAALVAAVLCLVGGELGLLIAAGFRGPAAAMYGLVLGLIARMAFPLLVGAALHVNVNGLAQAGMVFYLIAFYMVDLACETWLVLSTIEPSLPNSAAVRG